MAGTTILVVEDDPAAREVFAVLLRHRGHRVYTAEDGGTGIELAREHHPDAIVLDLWMRPIDGWELTRLLRRDERTRGIPLIAASIGDIPVQEAEKRWDAFVQKPCDPLRIAAAVDRVLEVSAGGGDES